MFVAALKGTYFVDEVRRKLEAAAKLSQSTNPLFHTKLSGFKKLSDVPAGAGIVVFACFRSVGNIFNLFSEFSLIDSAF